MLRKLWFAVSVAWVAFVGCDRKSEPATPLAPLEPGYSPASLWRWQAVSTDEWFAVAAPYADLPDRAHSVTDDPRATANERAVLARLEIWLDRLISAAPLSPRGVDLPRPELIVARDDEPNAFVAPLPVCVDVQIAFGSSAAIQVRRRGPSATSARSKFVPLVMLMPTGIAPVRPDFRCVRRHLSTPELEDMAKAYKAMGSGCVIALEGQTGQGRIQLVVGEGCPRSPELDGKDGALQFAYDATANRILVTTGLIERLDTAESQILPTLAHELSHYRFAHPSEAQDDHAYFFHVGALMAGFGPDPAVAAMGVRVSQYARLASLAQEPRGRYHDSLFLFSLALARNACQELDADCSTPCAKLSLATERADFDDLLGGYPEEPLDRPGQRAYLTYDRMLGACARTLRRAGLAALSCDAVNAELALSKLDEVVRCPEGPRTLAGLLSDLSQKVRVAARRAPAVIKAAEAAGLARHTAELVADEDGLRRFVQLGFTPAAWIEAELALERRAEEYQDPRTPSGFTPNACSSLWRHGWHDNKGEEVVPVRGNFYDVHPFLCYRVWHADRFARQYALSPKRAAPPTPPGPSWQVLARSVGGRAPAALR